MCGICGILTEQPDDHCNVVRAMNNAQAHRGPDGEGLFSDGTEPVYTATSFADRTPPLPPSICSLGHRRLAVIDPETGMQPMTTPDGKTTVVFNGEIYNFIQLRKELEEQGCRFRTDSDTEILLAMYRRNPENPAAWLNRLDGIFAFALWDSQKKKLLAARDPFGIKPLNYFSENGKFIFASEIKGLLAAGVKPRLNKSALHVFMNLRYVPGRETLFQGVHRLPAAHFAVVENGRIKQLERYYSLEEHKTQPAGGRPEIRARVMEQFSAAVRRQLVSDVPLGMALSGGLDSSMIVAAASKACSQSSDLRLADRIIRTFTLGFNEPSDENAEAAMVADFFHTQHHDTRLPAQPLKKAEEVIRAVEEPKINIMQGYELAGFVKPHVKVMLSGLGGDELFAGYDIHRYCNTLGRINNLIPQWFQKHVLSPGSSLLWQIQNKAGSLRFEHYRIGAQIALSAGDPAQFYTRLRNAWDEDPAMYNLLYDKPEMFRQYPRAASYFRDFFSGRGSFLQQVLKAEFHTKMVDDFLLNEDRVSSAHGVESRVPFLDKSFVELAFNLPVEWKMSGAETKKFWKECIGDSLPQSIMQKKKQGFSFSSYHQWTKDLRGSVGDNLTREWCKDTGLFNHDFVHKLMDYPPHPNMRWHYFIAWMMLGVKQWIDIFNVEIK